MRNEVEVATLLIVGTAARSADIKNTGHPDATAGCMAAPFDSTLPVRRRWQTLGMGGSRFGRAADLRKP
jgi:hypothetical protein